MYCVCYLALLKIVKNTLPIGGYMWDNVAREFNKLGLRVTQEQIGGEESRGRREHEE